MTLFALPLVFLALGVFFGVANGARAAIIAVLWLVLVYVSSIAAFSYGHMVLAIVIGTVGFLLSFWVAMFGGFAQFRVNPNAPAVKIAESFNQLSPGDKKVLGRLAGHAARLGAAYVADRVRASHPRTSEVLSRMSK